MMDISTVGWTVVIVALVLFAGFVYWLIDLVSKDRLMRCPETGSINFVGVEVVSRPDGKAPELTVRRCDLWPEKKDCARGCLVRYEQTSPGHPVNLDALRHFERQ